MIWYFANLFIVYSFTLFITTTLFNSITTEIKLSTLTLIFCFFIFLETNLYLLKSIRFFVQDFSHWLQVRLITNATRAIRFAPLVNDPYFLNRQAQPQIISPMASSPFDSEFQNWKKQNEAFILQALKEIINENCLLSCQLKPSDILLGDMQVESILMVSNRQLSVLREKDLINFSQPIPKGKVYYTYQDLIDFVVNNRNRSNNRKRKKK